MSSKPHPSRCVARAEAAHRVKAHMDVREGESDGRPTEPSRDGPLRRAPTRSQLGASVHVDAVARRATPRYCSQTMPRPTAAAGNEPLTALLAQAPADAIPPALRRVLLETA